MKIICIYHSRDLDGWMSAAIVKKWFLKNNKDNSSLIGELKYSTLTGYTSDQEKLPQKAIADQENTWFLGWDYGDEIPDLSSYDKIIIVDVAFPKDVMNKLVQEDKITWIDHHISAINDNDVAFHNPTTNGLRNNKFAACELTWKYFIQGIHGDPDKESEQNRMPEIVRLLGRYDCFGHKGTDEEQKVLEFQYGARACMSNYEECYDKLCHSLLDGACYVEVIANILESGKAIYKYLCTEARQTYKKAFPIEFKENIKITGEESIDNVSKFHTPKNGKIIYKFLCVNQERFNPVNFGIDYHKDGYDGFACFWLKEGKWHWSLYNDNGKVDCSVIAKEYGGGGHKGAAGMVIDTETLIKIINQ